MAVAATLAPRPPSPVPSSRPNECSRPRPQPLRTSGKVSQLGTFSFQPSMTAAATIATQMNHRGQWFRMKCMKRHPHEFQGGEPHNKASRGTRWAPRLAKWAVGGTRAGRSDARSRAGLADLGGDVAEGVVGVGAQGRDGRDADHDDQGEHDGVLDRGRAALVLQEAHHALTELPHWTAPSLCRT